MLKLETDDLHTMRTRGRVSHLAYIMLCAFFAKTFLYFYIEHRMEESKEEEPVSKENEVVSAMHRSSENKDVELAENTNCSS